VRLRKRRRLKKRKLSEGQSAAACQRPTARACEKSPGPFALFDGEAAGLRFVFYKTKPISCNPIALPKIVGYIKPITIDNSLRCRIFSADCESLIRAPSNKARVLCELN